MPQGKRALPTVCPEHVLQGEWGSQGEVGSWWGVFREAPGPGRCLAWVVGRAGVCQAGLRGWLFPALWPPHLFSFFSSGELSHLSPQTAFTSGLAEKGDDTFTALCPPGAGEPLHPSLTLLMFQGPLWFLALSSTEFLPWVWQPAWVRGTRLVPKVWGCLLARGFGWEGV